MYAEVIKFTFSNMKFYDFSLSFCSGLNLDSPMIFFLILSVWPRLSYLANMTLRF